MTMLTLDTRAAFSYRKPVSVRTGLHRLFAAAVVNDQFRETLLHKPEEALEKGYLGQTFALSEQERTILRSVRAETLTDLAQKVNRALKGV